MLSIDWRSPAAYGHTKYIPAAGFAWEYLRRNGDYRQDFQTIVTGGSSGPTLMRSRIAGVYDFRATPTRRMTSRHRSGVRAFNRKP
ncbi:transcriptional regulator domain-containing protein [Brevundimonas denitrificans]|uniref:transcriptional regulator domain-containing protein n=1 Tax=Brevundimonas denitrificans TaxID=1443434 RepID=UPI00223BCEF3|nr:DUF6499 domain-containing protein [Brevundimonas denitrificans]